MSIRSKNGENSDSVQAVVFAMQILRHLSHQKTPIGVTALAQELSTTKNRIHRHLRTLVQLGYVAQDEHSEKYGCGPQLMLLGRAVKETFDLVRAAREVSYKLRAQLGHTVTVSTTERDGVRALYSIPGNHDIEITMPLGALFSFHCTAQGKIALAFGDEALLTRVLRSRLRQYTPFTIVKPSTLRKEIARVRRKGWATCADEHVLGLNALAAPIRDISGRVCGTVTIVDALHYLPARPSQAQIEGVIVAARQISANMGYSGIRPTKAAEVGQS